MKIKTRKQKKRGSNIIPQNTKLLSLILTIPPSKYIHNQTKKWLVNLKLEDQSQKRPWSKKILTWECFVKNSLFGSLFPVNLVFSLRIFYAFWKDTMYGIL